MSNRILYGACLSMLFVTLLCAAHDVHAAIGVSPSRIYLEGMLPDQRVVRELVFSRVDTTRAEQYTLSAEGPLRDYVEVPDGFEFGRDEHRVEVPVRISSTRLPEGEYGVVIAVSRDIDSGDGIDESSSASSVVQKRLHVRVDFTVTNTEQKNFEVRHMRLREIEEGQDVPFLYTIANEGNVAARPSRVEIDFVNQENNRHTHSYVLKEDSFEITPPFSWKEFLHEMQNDLTVGLYTASVTFYDGEDVLFEEKDILYQVYPFGFLQQRGELLSLHTDKSVYSRGETMQIQGEFSNTGMMGVMSHLVVYIDGSGIYTSDQVYVPHGESVQFAVDVPAPSFGRHVVQGLVSYGYHVTPEKHVDIRVGKLVYAYIWAALSIFAIAFLIWKRRSRNTKK